MNNIVSWISAAAAGALIVLLLNISPVARMGLAIELPSGWQHAPIGAYRDFSCSTRQPEGIPFAVKRPNQFQTCAFDTNKLGLLLNGVTGMGLGLLVGWYMEKRGARDRKSIK